MPLTQLDKSILLSELNLIIQCSGIWWCCGFAKVKSCDGSLVSVNHCCRRGANAIFIVLRRNLVVYYNEPGEMYDSG